MKERNVGLLSTLACYILWGLLPLYWHILEDLDSVFILCNRIIWSAVFTIAILLITKKFSEVKAVFRDKKKMRFMIPAAITITINWGVYIWAVNAGHLLDSSLGYYMNPLVVFAIGIALFHETSSVLDWVSLALATVGVLIATIAYGAFPWIAIVLALSFGLYGTFKNACRCRRHYQHRGGDDHDHAVCARFPAVFARKQRIDAQLTPLTTTLLLLTGIVTASPLICLRMASTACRCLRSAFCSIRARRCKCSSAYWFSRSAHAGPHHRVCVYRGGAGALHDRHGAAREKARLEA
jgi:chloramphenicol-sensitive protein RarD